MYVHLLVVDSMELEIEMSLWGNNRNEHEFA